MIHPCLSVQNSELWLPSSPTSKKTKNGFCCLIDLNRHSRLACGARKSPPLCIDASQLHPKRSLSLQTHKQHVKFDVCNLSPTSVPNCTILEPASSMCVTLSTRSRGSMATQSAIWRLVTSRLRVFTQISHHLFFTLLMNRDFGHSERVDFLAEERYFRSTGNVRENLANFSHAGRDLAGDQVGYVGRKSRWRDSARFAEAGRIESYRAEQ